MIQAVQAILMLLMLFLALLTFMAVRQIGVLSRRIRDDDLDSPSLSAGTPCPVKEFNTLDGKHIALGVGEENYLLFLAFSCPTCRPLLKELHKLPSELRSRIVLFILDKRPGERYKSEVATLKDQSILVVEGYSFAGTFRVSRPPYVYRVDGAGIVRSGTQVVSLDELLSVSTRR